MKTLITITAAAVIACLFMATNVHAETPKRTLQWRTESNSVFLYDSFVGVWRERHYQPVTGEIQITNNIF